jgi:CO/xanthine dehydrogenase Mo-binding subunit
MAWSLIGKDFVPPDIHGKVTGRAKYAEDFRAEGMVFARLLTSSVPHATITNIDAAEALAMDGVVFNRTPVVPDMIINYVAGREQSSRPLQIHTA